MRACIFCKMLLTRENRSKEHVIARWIISALNYAKEPFYGRTLTYPNHPSVLNEASDVINEREQSIESLVLGNVCVTCNNGWMSALEVAVRPILEKLWNGTSPRILSRDTCDTLARWTFKTAATANYACDYKKIIPAEHLHWLYEQGRLPDNATVDIAFCEPDGIHWVLGGNRKLVTFSKEHEKALMSFYLVTLQIECLLLRLAWAPMEEVAVLEIPNGMCRISPIVGFDKHVQITRRWRDRWQLHFIGTIFAEHGVYPAGLKL